MASGDIYKWTAIGSCQAQTCMVTGHFRVTTGASASSLEQAIHAWLGTDALLIFAAAQSNEFEWLRTRAQKIWPLPAYAANEEAWAIPGGAISPAFPSEVAAVLKRLSAFAGVKGRGRVYLPGIPTGTLNQGTGRWAGTYTPDLVAAAGKLTEDITVGGAAGALTPVIFNRAAGTDMVITGSGINDVPRVQRRRQAGRGI